MYSCTSWKFNKNMKPPFESAIFSSLWFLFFCYALTFSVLFKLLNILDIQKCMATYLFPPGDYHSPIVGIYYSYVRLYTFTICIYPQTI